MKQRAAHVLRPQSVSNRVRIHEARVANGPDEAILNAN